MTKDLKEDTENDHHFNPDPREESQQRGVEMSAKPMKMLAR